MLAMLDKPAFLIVAVVALLLFGAKRLPDSARQLGRSMRILKAETKGLRSEDSVEDIDGEAVAVLPADRVA